MSTNAKITMLPTEKDLLPTEAGLTALQRIAEAIESAASLEEVLLLALRELSSLFAVERGAVVLFDEQGSGRVAAEYPAQLDGNIIAGLRTMPVIRQMARERRPIQLNQSDDGRHSAWEALRTREMHSVMLAPLLSQHALIGVLALGTRHEQRRFTAAELALLRVLTSQLAVAVGSARAQAEADRRSRELETLNDIATTITSTLDMSEVYHLVVHKLNSYFHVEAGSMLLLDETTGELEFAVTMEDGSGTLTGMRIPSGQGIVGYVVRTRRWEIVHDVRNDQRFYQKIDATSGFETRSVLCVPMIGKGRLIGVIELLNKINGHFTAEEAERLTRMAAFIGVAIENALLFQQVSDVRDRLAAILNSTADGILMADVHGVVLIANPMAAAVLDLPEDAILHSHFDAMIERLYGRAREVIHHQWMSEDADRPATLPVAEFDLPGLHRFVRLLRLPVYDANGTAYGSLAVLRDITQERELERLRDDYTSMMVHDLRAPLTAIMNGVAMVQRGVGGTVNDMQREILGIAYQGSQTMLELVNNLLDIARLEQGRMTLDLQSHRIETLISRAAERLQASAQSHAIRLERQIADDLPEIVVDGDKVVRVLQNLLDNAIKFSPSGGVVSIGMCRVGSNVPVPVHTLPAHHGDAMLIWIQDQGPGIPAAYHGRIFEKFGQVHTQKLRGSGLGLAFCKLAIEAHGGQIWVESEEGRGSIFAFLLPYHHPGHA